MSGKVVRLDATSLRGIAHPLRVRILGLLRENGPATSTLLAERLGQSTGATSYHLRQLASYGFVVEDEARGSARERWWQAAHTSTIFEREVGQQAPEDAEAYLRAIAAAYNERVDRWIGEATSLPAEWMDASTMSDRRLMLSPDEAQQLRAELFELINRYRPYDADELPEGVKPVVLQVQLMPFVGD